MYTAACIEALLELGVHVTSCTLNIHDVTIDRQRKRQMNSSVLEVFRLVSDAGKLERAFGKMCTHFETVCQSIGVFQRCTDSITMK